jgi:hypothetical protein
MIRKGNPATMDPISLLVIAAISLLGGTASAATIAYLTLPQVKAWFLARRTARPRCRGRHSR